MKDAGRTSGQPRRILTRIPIQRNYLCVNLEGEKLPRSNPGEQLSFPGTEHDR
jgi:hypothetical protein